MTTNTKPGVPSRCYTCGHRIVVMRRQVFGEIVELGHDPNCLAVEPDGRRKPKEEGK